MIFEDLIDFSHLTMSLRKVICVCFLCYCQCYSSKNTCFCYVKSELHLLFEMIFLEVNEFRSRRQFLNIQKYFLSFFYDNFLKINSFRFDSRVRFSCQSLWCIPSCFQRLTTNGRQQTKQLGYFQKTFFSISYSV